MIRLPHGWPRLIVIVLGMALGFAWAGCGGAVAPSTACVGYDQQQLALQPQIDDLTSLIAGDKERLDALQVQLTAHRNDRDVTYYNALIDQYTAQVRSANDLIAQKNALGDQYNTLAAKHNAECR